MNTILKKIQENSNKAKNSKLNTSFSIQFGKLNVNNTGNEIKGKNQNQYNFKFDKDENQKSFIITGKNTYIIEFPIGG